MEERQFTKFYKQFVTSIFRFLYFKVSDYDVAADLTAETFIRFWKVVKKEQVTNSKALLFSIANGIAIDYYRKKKNRKKISIETVDERLLGIVDLNEDQLSIKQEIEALLQQLSKLKKAYRDILLLYYLEELTISEISFMFHKTENNTRVLLHRAIQALKKLYE